MTALYIVAYVAFMAALALAIGDRLKQVSDARERLAQFKKRARQ